MRQLMRSMAFAVGGLTLLSAAVVLPDGLGRTGPAVAEVIHDGTDTTGLVHTAIDCDRMTPGTQDHCFVLDTAPSLKVDVTVGDETAWGTEIGEVYVGVATNELVLDPVAKPVIQPSFDTNPDFNEALIPPSGLAAWTCGPPPPASSDTNPEPTVAVSFIGCFGVDVEIPLTPGGRHATVATIEYDVAWEGVASLGFTYFSIREVPPDGGDMVTTVECSPPGAPSLGLCFGATVEVVLAGGDLDGDGVANSADNCIGVVNADQQNADANLFVQIPTLGVNDLSRANSDNLGNACDDDDDNDGLTDAEEGVGCNGGLPTSVTSFDTDGDRYLDGAECVRGTDPTSAASKPTAVSCGSTADIDGDRLMERIERCHYNTDPAVKDSDGDGMKDGCEAASLNGDGVVNSADQLLFSLQHLSVLAGFGAFANTDINKDGNYNSIDQLQMAFLIMPSGQCP